MARLSPDNVVLAKEIISRYPLPKSALIPLCHLAQEQDGYLTEEAMAHIAELVNVTPAEVLGTASFYEMFKMEPVGKYMINICTNIACQFRRQTRHSPRANNFRWLVHYRRCGVHRRLHGSTVFAGELSLRTSHF